MVDGALAIGSEYKLDPELWVHGWLQLGRLETTSIELQVGVELRNNTQKQASCQVHGKVASGIE